MVDKNVNDRKYKYSSLHLNAQYSCARDYALMLFIFVLSQKYVMKVNPTQD